MVEINNILDPSQLLERSNSVSSSGNNNETSPLFRQNTSLFQYNVQIASSEAANVRTTLS